VGRNRYQSAGTVLLQCSGAGHFYFILKGCHLGFRKNVLPLLEHKFLVLCERIGEAQKMVYDVLHSFLETVQHIIHFFQRFTNSFTHYPSFVFK
jgi:hypothetical protein